VPETKTTPNKTDAGTAPIEQTHTDIPKNREPTHISEPPWRLLWNIVAAQVLTRANKLVHRMTQRTLKIGISARIFHPQEGAKGLPSKTLQYLEESIAHWVMSRNVMVFMIPSVNTKGLIHPSNIRLRDYAKHLDGLVLQGGADVAPESYSQTATRSEWSGDRARDMYELELLHEFIEAGKPVLGICRGCQLLNVAFGGTLFQDIASDVPGAIAHVNELYDQNSHDLRFTADSTIAKLFSADAKLKVNSIHHQAVRTLGKDIAIEAISGADNIIEAIRYKKSKFAVGLQWHPEFHTQSRSDLLDCTPILDSFLSAARETRF